VRCFCQASPPAVSRLKPVNAASADPMIGRLIDGRYQVKSRIARGGMATVYLATDLRLERRVAVKIMHGHLADDSAFKARFVQEARSAARLAHPNVVNVFDQGQDSDMAYMVMEYLPGITLRDLLKDYGKLTAEQTLDIMDAVLSGLAAAHEAGIVHRDLKPENVLLADDGRIKLGDFGLARATTANTASGQALLGTIAYLSPELLTRGVADARSDIYAIGIMLYEMLTGEQPFRGEQPMQVAYQHANEVVPRPSLRNPNVPPALDDIVRWATNRSPEDRPENAGVLLERLLQAEPGIRSGSSSSDLSTQQTMVLPAGLMDSNAATDETRVFTGSMLAGAFASPARPANAISSLTALSHSRRTRGAWLLALVLVLAGLAGATGWYFGSGPGSLAQIPSVAGQTAEQAVALVTAEGFSTRLVDKSDVTVPVGLATATDPAEGKHVTRGSVITIFISTGPKILDVPVFAGLTEEAASSLAKETGFTQGDSVVQFSGDVAAGIVIEALDAAGAPLPATYPEAGQVSFVVSLGAIPSVVGLSLADATEKLVAAGLVVSGTSESFSDTVEKGVVISQTAPEGAVRRGAGIGLDISKGEDLVEVPNVMGLTIAQASAKLQELGFGFTTNVPAIWYNRLEVTVQSPKAGDRVKRGSTIDIRNDG
jgi:serine/threonine protein kinase/beta-lactam-binding protein with PASTA domain